MLFLFLLLSDAVCAFNSYVWFPVCIWRGASVISDPGLHSAVSAAAEGPGDVNSGDSRAETTVTTRAGA